jgi:formylglycine-generating enzyme required for sulfatase activity
MEPHFQDLLRRLEQLSAQVEELRQSIRQSVDIAGTDPEMSLTRARKALEYIVRDVYQNAFAEPAGTRPLENLLQRLVKEDHFPKRLAAYASAVRELGNVGTHGFGEGVTTQDVYQSLTQLLPIVEWYLQQRPSPAVAADQPEPTAPLQASTKPALLPIGSERSHTEARTVSPRPGRRLAWLALGTVLVLLVAGGLWAVFRQLQRVTLSPVVTNSLGMKFTWCPPGSFTMGSPEDETGRGEDETPHKVTLSKGFYLGVYPVTQAQWQAVMGSNPSFFPSEKGDRPVEMVLWTECREFCKKLGERDGKRYRLPTEAEWEYACRAGTTTAYYTGNGLEDLKRAGWCSYDGKRSSAGETKPVGQFQPNPWGLYDVHGNVYQWCAAQYGPYPKNEVTDPGNLEEGTDPVCRGGSWAQTPDECRAAHRWHGDDGKRYPNLGCRMVLCLD